jgi:heavy metal translocating P-type ATPase
MKQVSRQAEAASLPGTRLWPGIWPDDVLRLVRPMLVAIPATGLLLGLIARPLGFGHWAGPIWAAVTAPVLLVLVIEIITSLRRGDVGLDVVAALSMGGALAVGEHLAAVVVALMYAGGQYLESFAERRASREMTALLSRVPRTALRHYNGHLEEVALGQIEPGDRLLIGQGDVVAVDGTVSRGLAILDQAALTGESLPIERTLGEPVLSGSINAGGVFDLRATHRAAESTYAGIVRLVEAAQRSKAPMARLADRFAMVFLAVTAALAGGAWFWTEDPIRALAVLVIATPCPLILAVPVAIVSGVSRAAKAGVLVKGGSALETLSRVRALVIDKTGTLTHGRARVIEIRAEPGFAANEVLRLGASLDQVSKHVIARAIVAEAKQRALRLSVPAAVVETPGEGVVGEVDGRSVIVGGRTFVANRVRGGREKGTPRSDPGTVTVSVGIDGAFAGTLVLADEVRADANKLLGDLRRLGVDRIVLATGDRRDVAEAVGSGLSLDGVRSELTPEEKVAVVQQERKRGPVMMIGDGVNDAPALAAADLGVALGASGAAASAEAADVALKSDPTGAARHLHRVEHAVETVDEQDGLYRHRSLARRDGCCGTWLSDACPGRADAGGHRCGRDPERPESASRRGHAGRTLRTWHQPVRIH